MNPGSEKVSYIIEGKNLLSKTLAQIDKDADRTEGKISQIGKGGVGPSGGGSGGGILKSIVGGNLLAGGISTATGAMIEFGKESIQSFAKFEQFGVALTTMFHGNKEEAQGLSNELVKFAKETPFELTEIQAATRQMIAFGSTSGNVVEEMRRLGDVSSGIGAPLGDIAYLYGTIRTSGRAMTMDINQFANRGIPIWKELEKITGKSGQALRKMVEEGKIGFPQIEKVFQNMTNAGGQFAGMMDAQSKTLGGQLSNLSDVWEQLKVHTGESQQDILKGTTSWLTGMIGAMDKGVQNINRTTDALKEFGDKYNYTMLDYYKKWSGFDLLNPFGKSASAKTADYAGMIHEKYGAQGGDTRQKLQEKLNSLGNQYSTISNSQNVNSDDLDYMDIDDKQKMRDLAIIKHEQMEILGAIKNYEIQSRKTKEGEYGGSGKGGKEAGLGTGTTIEAGTPKNLYITINGGLVNTLKVEGINGDIPVSKIKEIFSRLFLEVTNDAHLAMR